MSRSRRILRIALLVGGIGQLPGILLFARLVGVLPAVAFALLVSAPFYSRLLRGLRPDGEEKGFFGFLLLLFYGWWGASLIAGFAYAPAFVIAWLVGATPRAAAAIALGAGALAGLAGVTWNRLGPRLKRVDVPVAGLDPALDGYRIAQLSDLHMGGHTPPERVRGWVDRVNALRPDLVAVTGDLITMGDTHLDRVAEELGRLRATDAVAVCLGNHDYFGDTARLVQSMRAAGLEVLRNEGRVVEGTAGGRYFLAGVDDTWTRRADVPRTLEKRPADLAAIVLAHDPKLFPACAERDATLVLSGHTHGGQLALPVFPRTFNIARLAFRHTAGLYKLGRSWLYVNRGAGTTGPPIRIGSPSEITLLTLRAV